MSESEKFFVIGLLREIRGHALTNKDLMACAGQGGEDDVHVRYARAYGHASACLDLIRIRAMTAIAFLEPAGEEVGA